MARKALGRGLDALIPAGGAEGLEPAGGGLIQIELGRISPSPFQPRQRFPEAAIKELSESIKAQGILQPLVVRPRAKGGYELIAGERRLKAAKVAGLETVPALVRDVDDKSALELSLVENLQREDLGPLEEAQAYRRLLTEFGYTQEELSRRVGKDRATVANALRLLNLPEDIKNDLAEGRITAGHARAMLMAGTQAQMRRIRDAAVKDGISVREAERLAKAGPGKAPAKSVKAPRGDVDIRAMEERLLRELGTKVKIVKSKKGGRIEIQFYTAEDLDRIYRRICG
ncbi:MAG TPA: ParB/RepB/Spo0J family partition protein [bacterium]|nr:ParB/RepB/Spo0J family partition protein [bacterium]